MFVYELIWYNVHPNAHGLTEVTSRMKDIHAVDCVAIRTILKWIWDTKQKQIVYTPWPKTGRVSPQIPGIKRTPKPRVMLHHSCQISTSMPQHLCQGKMYLQQSLCLLFKKRPQVNYTYRSYGYTQAQNKRILVKVWWHYNDGLLDYRLSKTTMNFLNFFGFVQMRDLWCCWSSL